MNYIVFDSETTNEIDCPFTYDIGWNVVDDEKNILVKRSFVVAEIFNDAELMESAYFAEKIPQYIADIKNGSRKVRTLYTIRKTLLDDCKRFGIKAIIAHNARFDYLSCSTTQRYLTKSKYRYFFPFGVEIWDSLKMARQTFAKSEDYKNFCFENGFVTKRNIPQLTAEVLYRYITNNVDFVESHTGLEDTLIEMEIFFACLDLDNSIECRLWAD